MKRTFESLFSSFLISLVMVFVLQIPAGAGGNVYWRGDASTSTKAAANFSPEAIPTDGDTLLFTGDSAAAAFVQDTVLSVARISMAATMDENFKQASYRITTKHGASFDMASVADTVSLDSTFVVTNDGDFVLETGPAYNVSTTKFVLLLQGTGDFNNSTGTDLYVGGLSCANASDDTTFTLGAAIHTNGYWQLGDGVFDVGPGIFRFRNTASGTGLVMGSGHRIEGGTVGIYTNIHDTLDVPAINSTGMDATSHLGFVNYYSAWNGFAGFRFTGNQKWNKVELINNAGAPTTFIFDCDSVTCKNYTFGNANAFWIDSIYMRANYNLNSTIFTYDSSFSSTYYNGTACSWVYFQTSQHFFKGKTFGPGSYTKFIPGTSTLNLTGTGKQTIKMANRATQHLYDLNAPNAAGSWVDSTTGGLIVDGDVDLDKSSRLYYGLQVAGDFSFDSAGTTPDTLQIVDSLVMTGPSSQAHFGKMVSQNTAMNLRMNTATAGVIDDDKGIAAKSLTLGASAVVTNSGSETSYYSNAGTVLTIGNNSSFTVNRRIDFGRQNAGVIASFPATYTFNGATEIRWYADVVGTVTFPAMIYTGTGNFQVQGIRGGAVIALSGNVSCYRFSTFPGGSYSTTFNQSGYSLATAENFNFGSSLPAASFTGNLRGDLTITGAVNATAYNSGTTTINDSAGTKTVGGNLTWQTTHTHNAAPGSAWNITGTSTVTSAGKFKPDSLCINAPTFTVTMADRYKCRALNIAAGTMAVTNHAGADSVTGSMWVNGTATLNASGDSIDFLGNATFAAGATHTTDASTLYRFFGNNAILTTAGKAQPTLQFYNNYRINDGATIRRLTWGTDGKQGTFEAGETWTLTNLATADWSGVLGSLNAMRSSVNGTAFVMAIPAGVTLNYVDTRDCRITGFTITCNNCITQGGNY